MRPAKVEPLSAQVVLKPADKTIEPPAQITAETLKQHLPSPEAVSRLRRFFEEHGFEVSAAVGNSFSITAPRAAFERFFGVKLTRRGLQRMKVVAGEGRVSYEFPLGALPSPLAEDVLAIVVTPPPDFGPREFFHG
jgi:hypothetical protein